MRRRAELALLSGDGGQGLIGGGSTPEPALGGYGCRAATAEMPLRVSRMACQLRNVGLSSLENKRPGERALVAVSISAELPRGASVAVAGGGSSGPARGYQRAAAGHARAHRRGPRRPASALTSSRRPARHVGCLPRPDRVPG